jgi:hypothetical protein
MHKLYSAEVYLFQIMKMRGERVLKRPDLIVHRTQSDVAHVSVALS